MKFISEQEWHKRKAEYKASIVPFTTGYRERKGRALSHPIYDFLFSYYTFSSAKLEKWHPGYGNVLEVLDESKAKDLLENPLYDLRKYGAGVRLTLSKDKIRERDLKQLSWIHSLSKAIAERAPKFSCLGLHEWAMVYKSPEIRHSYPLRLTNDEIENLLESSTVACSHFDAFRFFTPKAVSLNVIQPDADSRLAYEQGGCLHANMDLYKWSFKLLPWVSSELVKDCFLLAIKAREIDMRASPYDFSTLGFEPIKIETTEGQLEYKQAQRDIALQASILREDLMRQIEMIWNDLGGLTVEDSHSVSLPI